MKLPITKTHLAKIFFHFGEISSFIFISFFTQKKNSQEEDMQEIMTCKL